VADGSPHRRESRQYQEAWDWDLIVYPDGSIRVLCFTHGCLYGGHSYKDCDCADRSRMSSPVVDDYRRPLAESPYSGGETGAARHLLVAREGTEILVLSGKHYKLAGPRMHHEGFRGASIWEVYREPEQKPEPRTRWRRICDWVAGA